MGNFYGSSDNTPSHVSYQQCKDLAEHLNKLFKQNEILLKIGLELNIKQIKYSYSNWRQSSIPGKMYVVEEEKYSEKNNIVMALRHVYKIHENMKHFQKQMEEQKNKTPSAITPDDSVECCICMDKAPTMMLPCSHEYCDKCTQTHIIDALEKKCPKCRRQFKCGRESMQKQIFTVIQEDILYDDLRKIILDTLSELNQRQVANIRKKLKSKSFVPEI